MRPWVAILLVGLGPRTAGADVKVWVIAPTNLADTPRPMPELRIRNDTSAAIELDVFGDVPFTILERQDAGGAFTHDDPAICGNGFVARRLDAGRGGRFPLWSLISHGPGTTGTYRVVLPYARVESDGRRVPGEATSRPFRIAYGDVAPPGWSGSSTPGGVSLVATDARRVRSGVDPDPAAGDVAAWLSPGIARCVAAARGRLPWMRGTFTLVVYHYPGQVQPVTYVGMSLLGDEALNACLAGLTIDQDIAGSYDLTFEVSATSR
ncbi:MAG: hypothetical protein HYY06_10085 [Deltaproteobacteria bacterium]|nr:hypothetical protein [Deltaproteobacteria bacterium]